MRLRDKAYPPSQFIPVAEITGLIVEIDRIVTKRSVEQLAIWKRRNKRMRPISINFSPVHLARDDDYVTYLLSLLKTYDVSSEYIKIEVTETLFSGSNQQKAEDLIKRLFDAGISIALDNFGMGYTSFTDIMAIPASIIKIDKEFVDTLPRRRQRRELRAARASRAMAWAARWSWWAWTRSGRSTCAASSTATWCRVTTSRSRCCPRTQPVQTPRVAANETAAQRR